MRIFFSVLIALVVVSMTISEAKAGKVMSSDWDDVARGRCSDQNSAWWSSDEAIRIAENVLLYQRDIGGWPKNIDMHLVLSESEKNTLIANKSSMEGGYCTIDNGAVKYELGYLSRVYAAVNDELIKADLKEGFLKGVQYLIDIQFDNGGWPQFFPFRSLISYSNHITYNDNAMVNVMEILRHIYQKDSEYSIVANEAMTTAARNAFEKGVDCILNTQYLQKGILTSWCAQHHNTTLKPVKARSYELASLSGGESSDVIELLMSINEPDYKIRQAVYYSVNWYNEVRVKGKRLESYVNSDGLDDKHIVYDENASDMWARFYTLEDNTPFFCDRDGIMKFSIAEIGHERRNGYSWYGNYGRDVVNSYDSWFNQWGRSDEQETKITLPEPDAEFLQGVEIPVFANANEYAFGSIVKFELLLDDVLLHEFTAAKIDTAIIIQDAGNHSFVVRSTDNKGRVVTDTTFFAVVAEDKTALNDEEMNKQLFYCYPNPAGTSFSVNLGDLENARINIYDLSGSLKYQTNANKGLNVINDHDLNPGVYLFQINSNNVKNYPQKLIVR